MTARSIFLGLEAKNKQKQTNHKLGLVCTQRLRLYHGREREGGRGTTWLAGVRASSSFAASMVAASLDDVTLNTSGGPADYLVICVGVSNNNPSFSGSHFARSGSERQKPQFDKLRLDSTGKLVSSDASGSTSGSDAARMWRGPTAQSKGQVAKLEPAGSPVSKLYNTVA